MSRRILWAAPLAAALFATAAYARGTNVMVLELDGKKTGPIRDRIQKAVKKTSLHVEPAGADARAAMGDDDALKKVAKKHKVQLFVVGGVEVSKKGAYSVHLTVKSADSGETLGETTLEAPKLPALMKKIDEEVPSLVKDGETALEATTPSAEPLPEKEEEKPRAKADEPEEEEPKEKPEKDDKLPKHRPSPLSVDLGLKLFSRQFKYNQDVNANLRPYSLSLPPAFFLDLAWYPAAHFTGGVAANIGVVGGGETSVGAESKLSATGTKYESRMLAWSAGLKWRIPFDVHELGVSARYGVHSFEVKGDADPAATTANGTAVKRDLLPDVKYTYFRPAIDARFAFGDFGVGAAFGYRVVLSTGDLENDVWFPKAKAHGIDGTLYVSYRLAKPLYVLAGFDIRRYGIDMHASPSDVTSGKDAAGGAVDQYMDGFLGIEFRPPGD